MIDFYNNTNKVNYLRNIPYTISNVFVLTLIFIIHVSGDFLLMIIFIKSAFVKILSRHQVHPSPVTKLQIQA